ncbi:class I SAM-dependent DNA methyltransferase [Nocardia sp. NPDC001965]
MPAFAEFDRRHYRTVDVATGYDGWAATYDRTVLDFMDLALLERLRRPAWKAARRAADLGCGTGRTAAWLRRHSPARIDGIDLSAEMLSRARDRDIHSVLALGDARDTGFPGAAYDLVISALIDEHLPDLAPFYTEARRLATPGGMFVLVSYHPQFMMVTGMPTHYTGSDGEPLAISTHLHTFSDHVTAASAVGWQLAELAESSIDDTWIAAKPKWSGLRGHPFTMASVWV